MARTQRRRGGRSSRRERKHVPRGQIHVRATFNNTIITVTDPEGSGSVLGQFGHGRIQGEPQEHAVCGPACGIGGGSSGGE